MSDTSKIAVFFDAENVSANYVPGIISYLSKQGDVLYQRAYADWSLENMKEGWKKQISQTPITAIHQFHHKQEQAVDKVLMMDAVELAVEHEEIDIFAIVASDNGYHSLSRKLKNRGKKVIGVGDREKLCNSKTNSESIWVRSCNEFRYFDEMEDLNEDILSQDKSEDAEMTGFAMEKFLEQAFDMTPTYNNSNAVLMRRLWESIKKKKPDFNVENYGAKNIQSFIASFKNFKITDDGKQPPTYFVEKDESFVSDSERKIGVVKRYVNAFRIIESDGEDYFFYIGEINKEFKGDKLKVGTKVDFLVEKKPDPDGTDSRERNGRATDVRVLNGRDS